MASKRFGIYLLLVIGWTLSPWLSFPGSADTGSAASETVGLPALIGPRPTPLPADSGTWRADPFAETWAKQSKAETRGKPKVVPHELKLQGILTGVKGRYALLNGQVMMVGDEDDGVRVLRIERDRIIVEDAAGRRVLPIFSK